MLITKIFYSVKCDKCGKMQTFDCEGNDCSESDAEADYEVDKTAAYETAKCNDWLICDRGDYCEDCREAIEEEVELKLTKDEFVNLLSMIDHNEFCDRLCKDKPGERTCHKCPVQSLFDKFGDAEDAI